MRVIEHGLHFPVTPDDALQVVRRDEAWLVFCGELLVGTLADEAAGGGADGRVPRVRALSCDPYEVPVALSWD